MSTTQFITDNDDLVSEILNSDSNYFTAHDAVTGTVSGNHAVIVIGQNYYVPSPSYSVKRGYFCFDTSGLDDAALIQSATLTLQGNTNHDINCDVILKNGQPTYPRIPQVVGDYLYTLYSGNGGVATPEVTGRSIFTLNYLGLSWINKTGYTKFLVMSENDNNREFVKSSGTPYYWEAIEVYGNQSGQYATLSITYVVPTQTPVVGEPTFSNTKATYTKATANVSDVGGGYAERGFEYGLSETPTWAVRETGVWGTTGDFSMVISGLTPLTTYYARAYVVNDYGTGYSDWTSFTTTDVPTYGIHEESNSPTICFYVRRAGGKWSIKHGPYTEDQADIEIGKILVEGKGKYQIKFTSDVLTGLSVNIMTKLDIRAR